MPNDLVGRRSRPFLTSPTPTKTAPGSLQTIETYLQLSGAQVIFYARVGSAPPSRTSCCRTASREPDGRRSYVASTTGRAVRFYDRDLRLRTLAFRQENSLGSGADNIEIDAHGNSGSARIRSL